MITEKQAEKLTHGFAAVLRDVLFNRVRYVDDEASSIEPLVTTLIPDGSYYLAYSRAYMLTNPSLESKQIFIQVGWKLYLCATIDDDNTITMWCKGLYAPNKDLVELIQRTIAHYKETYKITEGAHAWTDEGPQITPTA